ncbi:MAG: S-methyl-5'-thioadenosine phosphorylase, partial [Prochlorococcaceae cyanobacterium ETNP18_MAG_17]|nr:S-methyl-5'-thioadenosine phosphorylase [Prochlorococcaceae cyanobacterium ETNP18_MAG_17]
FSTRAESNLYRSWGCSVIGMTNHTEARLAREAEIAYASLAMVTDYDCWHAQHEAVTIEMVISNLRANSVVATNIVRATAEKVASLRPFSTAHNALEDGLLTTKDIVPSATRLKLDLFTRSYWGKFGDS